LNAQAPTEQALRGLIVSGGRQEFESRISEGLGVSPAGTAEAADFVICDLDQEAFDTARRAALANGKSLCLVIPGPLPLHSKTTPSSFSYVMLKATILSRYGHAGEAAIRALLAGALQAGRAIDTSVLGLWRALPSADERSPRRQEADPENRALQILMETGGLPDAEPDGFWRILAEACAGSQLELDRVIGPLLQKTTAWFEPYHQGVINAPGALDILHLLETRRAENSRPAHCVGAKPESRPFISAAFLGSGGTVSSHDNEAEALAAADRDGGVVLSVGSTTYDGLDQACREKDIGLLHIDANFARLAGLDPFLPPAAMLAADDLGMHDDASRASRLETLLQTYELNAEEMNRGAALLDKLARAHASLDSVDPSRTIAAAKGRKTVLVPGEAGKFEGGATDATDRHLHLLRHVRKRNPDAFIIFKPHPDMNADRGLIRKARRYADHVASKADMSDLIGRCDAVETVSSVSGFAALLRGVPVTVHGLPFYAGWGLTEDLATCPRRTARRTLSDLVYLTLAVYARCTDPVSLLPCPPEVLIDRAVARQQEVHRAARPHNLNPISWLGRKLGL
jgi:capsular polysaccharide export protein